MASIAQLVSEIAHSLQQADSVPVRRAIKLAIIHARNDLIRKSYASHNYTDKILMQKVRISLINVPDGDSTITTDLSKFIVKRSVQKLPRPVRLTNNLPLHSVRTINSYRNKSIPFVRESATQFYDSLPGMCSSATWDLINEYLYIVVVKSNRLSQMEDAIVESVFEYPQIIATETSSGIINVDDITDDNEFLLPEDMITGIKALVFESFNAQVVRQDNEIPTPNLTK